MVTAVVHRASFHSISFVARPLRPIASRIGLYLSRTSPRGTNRCSAVDARVRRTTHLCAPHEVVVQPFVPASGEHKSSVKLPRVSVPPSVM